MSGEVSLTFNVLNMHLDGKKLVRDLNINRSLWQAVLSDEFFVGRENLVKLRDVERFFSNPGIMCVSIRKDKKEDFERLAEKWNPVAIQFLPVENESGDDLVAELHFL